MLEKIGTPGHEFISKPDEVVLKFLSEILKEEKELVYYEVGVGIGATTAAVARAMANQGLIYLFSRQHEVQELKGDLANLGFTNVNADWGSPRNTFSGYHFEIARSYIEQSLPSFNLAYIDGAHLYHFDAPATCILKELCKVGGYMIFDDWSWSLEKSWAFNPQRRPATAVEYDPLQITTCHVQYVCKTIMDPDPRYKLITVEADSAVYQRIQ